MLSNRTYWHEEPLEAQDPEKMEEALVKITARFDGVINSAMDAIVSIDARQRIVLFNPAAEKMFGIPAKEALGQHINQLIPQRFQAAHMMYVDHFGITGESKRQMGGLGTVFGLRANGEEFPLEASISQVEVRGEKIFTAILRDITKRKQAEEALKKSHEELERLVQERTAKLQDSLADLEEFTYAIVHDIRAPLRAMQTFAGLLKDECVELRKTPFLDYLERITISAAHLDRLLQDTLAYSRISYQDLQLEPVEVKIVLAEIIATNPDLQSPKAEIRIDLDGVVVRGNKVGITQCLANLLSNAVKFVAPGIKPFAQIWAENRGTVSRIYVADNGIGVPKAAQAKIFGMFQRMHRRDEYPGTGMGLAIVRKAVQRMGGKVGVESKPGEGSRFWVELTRES